MHNIYPHCQPRKPCRLCRLRAFNLPLQRYQPCLKIGKWRTCQRNPLAISCQPCGEGTKPFNSPPGKRCGLDKCFEKAPPLPKVIYVPMSNAACCKCKAKKKCVPKCKPCFPSKKCCSCCPYKRKKMCKPMCNNLDSNFACKVETMASKLRITIYKPPGNGECKPICCSPQLEDCQTVACESDLKLSKSKKKKCTCSSCQKPKTSPYESTSTLCKCKKEKKSILVSKSTCTCSKRIPISHESDPSICRTRKKKKSVKVSKSACNCTRIDVSTCESIAKVCMPMKKKRRSKISGNCCRCKTPLTITEVFRTKKNPKCVISSSSSGVNQADNCEILRLRCPQPKKPQEVKVYPLKSLTNFKCKDKFADASLWTVFK